MKLELKYRQYMWGTLIFEFIFPLFPIFFLILLLYFWITTKIFSEAIYFAFLWPIWFIFNGSYSHMLQQIFRGLWKIQIYSDGIYGKKFLRFIFFMESKKLASWDEIEEVRFVGGGFRHKNTNMGHIEFTKTDGKKFIICFFGASPFDWDRYFADSLLNAEGYGYNLEMMAVIGWKVGLDKFKDFPPFEGIPKVRRRRVDIILAMEGIQRVVNLIKENKSRIINIIENKESSDAGTEREK